VKTRFSIRVLLAAPSSVCPFSTSQKQTHARKVGGLLLPAVSVSRLNRAEISAHFPIPSRADDTNSRSPLHYKGHAPNWRLVVTPGFISSDEEESRTDIPPRLRLSQSLREKEKHTDRRTQNTQRTLSLRRKPQAGGGRRRAGRQAANGERRKDFRFPLFTRNLQPESRRATD
jgi:hypothetical protein